MYNGDGSSHSSEKKGRFYEHLNISFPFLSFPSLKGPRDNGGDWHFSHSSVVLEAVRKKWWWQEQWPKPLLEASRTFSANLFRFCSQLLHIRTPWRWQSTRLETRKPPTEIWLKNGGHRTGQIFKRGNHNGDPGYGPRVFQN